MIAARPTARDSLLFVYGTLLAFVATAAGDRLRRQSSLVARAKVAGRLYDLGRYPGLAPSRRPGEWVIGELYRLTSPRFTLRALDLFEAGAGPVLTRFTREPTIAYVGSRARRRVWVYRFVGPVRAERRLAGGDYERHIVRARGWEPANACDRGMATQACAAHGRNRVVYNAALERPSAREWRNW